jgi:hypothetical protein
MNGKVNRAIAHQSKPTSRWSGAMSRRKVEGGFASAEFRFDTPQLFAGSFIDFNGKYCILKKQLEVQLDGGRGLRILHTPICGN